MKLLLLSVAVLCLTGAQGRVFWQQDEPSSHPEYGFWKLWDHICDIYAEVFRNLKFEEIAEEYKIKEKLLDAKDNMEKIEDVIEEYIEGIHKKYKEEINTHFPVFSKEVAPRIHAFEDKVEEEVLQMVRSTVTVGSDLIHGLKKHSHKFYQKVKDIAEHTRDKVRTDVDELRSKVQPFAGSVHSEYEKYKEGIKHGFGDKLHQAKDNVEEELKELSESLGKLLGELKEHLGPHAKNLYGKIEHVIKEIAKAYKEDEDEQVHQEEQTQQQESS